MRLTATIIACAIALAACSPPAQTGAGDAAPTEAAAPTESAVPAEGVPTREQLVGVWGDNGNCNATVAFNADGTFAMAGDTGTWTLEGDRLTMTGDGGTFERRVAVGGADTLMIGNPDGSFGISQRC